MSIGGSVARPEPGKDGVLDLDERLGALPESPRWRAFIDAHRRSYTRLVRAVFSARALVSALLLLLAVTGGPFVGASRAAAVGFLGVLLLIELSLTALSSRLKSLEEAVRLSLALGLALQVGVAYALVGVSFIAYALPLYSSVITAALLVSRRGALISASVCSVLLAVIAVVTYFVADGARPPPLLGEGALALLKVRRPALAWNLVGLAASLHAVAALSGALPIRMTREAIVSEEILSRLREGIVVIDSAGRVAYINPEATRLFGWDGVPSIMGESFPQVLRRGVDRRVLEVLTAGADIHGEIEWPLQGGGTLAIEAKTSVLRDALGRTRGVVGIFNDTTAKKKVALYEQRLERLRSLGEMAVGIAHEIRNPLASIRGAMQELARRAFAEEDDRLLASIVLRESDRLDGILDSFMQYARMKPPEPRPADLVSLLEEVAVLMRVREDAAGVSIRVEADPRPLPVAMDLDQIKQVFTNLCVNALQALGGEGSLSIAARLATLRAPTGDGGERLFEDRPAAEVTVTDDGPGIKEAARAKLFTPFFSTKQGGTGLGLALAQKIVDAHGGDLACESRPGAGATFRVLLPLGAEEP